MPATPKTLRTRNMKTAEKTLALIRDAADMHLKILEEGRVPEASFTAPVAKYETALAVLRTLDAIGEASSAEDGEPSGEVRLDDLGVLIQLVSVTTGPDALAGDSPLGRLARVAFPDGAFADGQGQEPGHGYWERGDD